MQENWNSYVIRGTVCSNLEYLYEVTEKTYYEFKVKLQDGLVVSVWITDDRFDLDKITVGTNIFVKGILRSERRQEEFDPSDHKTLILGLEADIVDYLDDNYKGLNNVILQGYLCSKLREGVTKSGKKFINVLMAANKDEDIANYIPCSFYGELASVVSGYEIGKKIEVHGPLRMRVIKKKCEDGSIIEKESNYIQGTWLDTYSKGYINKDGYIFGNVEV